VTLASLGSVTKRYLQWPHRNVRRMTGCIRTFIKQEERRRDKTPWRTISDQSLMKSLGGSQQVCFFRWRCRLEWMSNNISHHELVDSASVWHLSITESKLTRSIIVTWCCYDTFRPPYVRCQAKFFIF